MLNPNLMPEDLELPDHYPMIIEYANGTQDIISNPEEIPSNVAFFVVETNVILEGRIIVGSTPTKQ